MPRYLSKEDWIQRIPEVFWDDSVLFEKRLPEELIPLMNAEEYELIDFVSNFRVSLYYRRLLFIAVAIAHPQLNIEMLLNIATVIRMDADLLMDALATLGNREYVKQYLSQLDSVEQERVITKWGYYTAARYGHIGLLEFFESLFPHQDQINAMIKEDDYFSFHLAALNGQVETMQHIVKMLSPELCPAMLVANNGVCFRVADRNKHTEALHYLRNTFPTHFDLYLPGFKRMEQPARVSELGQFKVVPRDGSARKSAEEIGNPESGEVANNRLVKF